MAQLIISPDAGSGSTTVDCGVFAQDAVWATVRAKTATTATPDNSSTTIYTEAYSTGAYSINRTILTFNTASIPTGSIITSATLELYKNATAVSNDNSSAICLVGSTPASNNVVVDGDFDQLGSTRFATDVNYSSISTNAYFTITLNATGLAAIVSGGITKLGLRDKKDLDNSTPVGVNSIAMNSADSASNKPRLTINYTPPASFLIMF